MMASKWPAPQTLKKQIGEYFDKCKDQFPDYAGMLLHLGLFPDEVQAMCDDELNPTKASEYRRVFEFAELMRESWLSRIAASDSKLAAGAFNLLKQQKNGGYTSASAQSKGNTLRLIVDGVGGMDAFK